MGNCDWALASERDRLYHDREWGVPVWDDRRMFEHLTLECLQCGLSWTLMLKKREVFRQCFADFDYDALAACGEADVQRILNTPGMLRSAPKVRAVLGNARCCQQLRAEFGSLCRYFWGWTGGKTVLYAGHAEGRVPASNGLSAEISRDLKRRGFQFVGPVTVYAHLQACGIVNDHARDCPCYQRINAAWPTVTLRPDREVG